MKHLLITLAALAVLAPLSANAQERMSDSRYLAANRCLAYADLGALQGDSANFSALREAAAVGNRERTIDQQVRQSTRSIQARATNASAEQLRTQRDEACASFAERGLVQLGGSSTSD